MHVRQKGCKSDALFLCQMTQSQRIRDWPENVKPTLISWINSTKFGWISRFCQFGNINNGALSLHGLLSRGFTLQVITDLVLKYINCLQRIASYMENCVDVWIDRAKVMNAKISGAFPKIKENAISSTMYFSDMLFQWKQCHLL